MHLAKLNIRASGNCSSYSYGTYMLYLCAS